jgi:hypothetical protein
MNTRITTVASLAVLFIAASALAQAPNQGGGGRAPAGAQHGGAMAGGAIDLKQFQQQVLDSIHEKLEVSDDDWTKLEPKIQKVMEAQRNARSGAGLAITRSSGAGTAVRSTGGGELATPPGKAMQEVRVAVEDKQVSDEQMTKKIAAFRETRDKARGELEAAQKELKGALTPKQEGVLLMMGLIE